MRPTLRVEIWSDVVCPWCYIGKRRFERAAGVLGDEVDLQIHYRPFQLDPTAPLGAGRPVVEAYAAKFGGVERATQILDHVTAVAAGEGLTFRMDLAVRANTLSAHRLLWLAAATGHQLALKERLLAAYFCEGVDLGDHVALAACAAEVGLPADRVGAFLDGTDGAAQIVEQLVMASDADITAVPTYVFDGRWVVPGAQDPDTFVSVVRRLIAEGSDR